MKLISPPATIATALALFASLGLAGCAVEGPPIPIESGTGGGMPSESPTTEGEGGASGVVGDCLVGDWVISESELQGWYSAVGEKSGLAFSVDGTTGIVFTATSYEYLPDFALSFELPGGLGEVRGEVSGSVRGDYSVADGVITTVHDESDLALDATIAGRDFDLSDMENDLIAEYPVNNASYSCDGGTPTIDFSTGDGTHPVRLTAA